jgi:hypothetical protein
MASTSISFEHDAAIFDLPPGNDLEVANLGFGFGAAIDFDEADHDIHTFSFERVRVFEHRIGLPHARCSADVDAETGALLGLQLREYLLTGEAASVCHASS